MIHKGMVVYYYPHGEKSYSEAVPALVMDHSPCGTVATLKVLRIGQDITKQHVKIDGHPTFEQFPHQLREHGFFAEIPGTQVVRSLPSDQSPSKQKSQPQQAAPQPRNNPNDTIVQQVQKLAASGMSPNAIVARLKDTGIQLHKVMEIINEAAPA